MKYLKKFKTHAEYEAYKNSQDYLTPNVSWCLDNNEVHFNKYTLPYDPFNGHEYVDLGLPSGTLWAKCNVGAETETEYGQYFQWGDTQGYTYDQIGTDKNFSWSDYKYGAYDSTDTTNYGMTKYNATDGLTTLELSDDAAHANMGGDWTMPTKEQIEELCELNHESITIDSIEGVQFIGTNGNKLFIPTNTQWIENIDNGIWSSSLGEDEDEVMVAFTMYSYDAGETYLFSDNRHYGLNVRGVID